MSSFFNLSPNERQRATVALVVGLTLAWFHIRCEETPALGSQADLDSHLTYCAAHGDLDSIKTLVKQGAHFQISDDGTNLALLSAALNGHGEAVRILMKCGATPTGNVLCSACKSGNIEMVTDLLGAGMKATSVGLSKTTPLCYAKNSAIAKLLIDSGASISAIDEFGRTPLHWAVRDNHIDVVALLISKQADVNVADKNGKTSLDVATTDEVRTLLAKAGAVKGTGESPEKR